VEKGRFRRDLFYRINVFPIHVPPLRKRKDDIPILMEYFTEKFCLDMKRPRLTIPSWIADIFVHYDWPGNVRELQNVIERLVVLSQNNSIRIEDIPEEIKIGTNTKAAEKDKTCAAEGSLLNARHEFEKECILKALDNNEWNITRTAKELKLARKNLYKKMKEYRIENL
jgi:two-component system nitrogen regulation response regulator NtrX